MSEAERNRKEHHDSKNKLDCVFDILTKPQKLILPLLYSTGTSKKSEDNGEHHSCKESERDKLIELLHISKYLFANIESLGTQLQKLDERDKSYSLSDNFADKLDPKTRIASTPSNFALSGLLELYIPPEVQPTDNDLPETIFGQVYLQTAALAKLVKKSTKLLIKNGTNVKTGSDISILDMRIVDSDNDDDHISSSDDRNDENIDKGMKNSDDDDDSDEGRQRIRQRMERALHDMGEDGESSDNNNIVDDDETEVSLKNKEQCYDPVVEDLKDGFFDLNEMEEFANEEEEYLPSEPVDQHLVEVNKSKKKIASTKTFHGRQRDLRNKSNDSKDGDIDDLDEIYEAKDITRKKYRNQEDIDALFKLYQEMNVDNRDDDDDAVNMTASDYFGKPEKKYINRYTKKHRIPSKAADAATNDENWGESKCEKEHEDFGKSHYRGSHDDNNEVVGMMKSLPSSLDTAVKTKAINDTKKWTKKEEKIQHQTNVLEMELINEKPWQMKGESKSSSRPINSLLEGTPDFEMASKQAPVITVEYTVNLEETIKKRILAEDWDDIVPRELPDIGWNKKRGEAPEVSQEKSKLGLGELYEREYLKKVVGFDKDAAEKQTEEDRGKDEMKHLFANLCSKLDALSNYHFAPRPIADEVEAIPITVPAIAMEEVLPLRVSDARGIAPEEVFARKRGREGVLRTDTELNQNDRKRQRQSKKGARRKARKEKEVDEKLISRLQPGLGLNNPYEKRKAREELFLARARGQVTKGEKEIDSKFGSSETFFKRLQIEAQQISQDEAGMFGKSLERREKSGSSAFKL